MWRQRTAADPSLLQCPPYFSETGFLVYLELTGPCPHAPGIPCSYLTCARVTGVRARHLTWLLWGAGEKLTPVFLLVQQATNYAGSQAPVPLCRAVTKLYLIPGRREGGKTVSHGQARAEGS